MADEETRDEIERLRERAAFYELEARFATTQSETKAAQAKAARLNALVSQLSSAALEASGGIPLEEPAAAAPPLSPVAAARRPRRARPSRS